MSGDVQRGMGREFRPRAGPHLKLLRDGADDWRVSTSFVVVATSRRDGAGARQQFSEIELAHALRAIAAQQLRVVAARHGGDGRGAARIAALEQAIADRIERIVQERRAATMELRAPIGTAPTTPRDELAARRTQPRRTTGGRALA